LKIDFELPHEISKTVMDWLVIDFKTKFLYTLEGNIIKPFKIEGFVVK
jgi:hypothetical protein